MPKRPKKARVNSKGRNANQPFIKLHRGVTQSSAWLSLSCASRSLLLQIWEKHNGSNNGRISYSHRQARGDLHCGNTRVAKSFLELQEQGFLIERRKGSFTQKTDGGGRRATEWEITTEACDDEPAKHSYRGKKI